MASALPLILLAGAAVILMGRGGDDDEGGGGDGGANGGGGDVNLGILGAGIPYSILDTSDKYGVGTTAALGTKSNPIEYTGAVTILDAPSVGTWATGRRFRQKFRLGDAEGEWLVIEDLVSVTTESDPLWKVGEDGKFAYDDEGNPVFDEDASRTLMVKNKGSTPPGLFSVKWYNGPDGIEYNSGKLWFQGK